MRLAALALGASLLVACGVDDPAPGRSADPPPRLDEPSEDALPVGARVLAPWRTLGVVRGRVGPIASRRPATGCLEGRVVSQDARGVVVRPRSGAGYGGSGVRDRRFRAREVLRLPSGSTEPPAIDAWVCVPADAPGQWTHGQVRAVDGDEVRVVSRSVLLDDPPIHVARLRDVVVLPPVWAAELAAHFEASRARAEARRRAAPE